MDFTELNKLAEEIAFLRKSNELLEEVSTVLGPYTREINGTDIGDLAEKFRCICTSLTMESKPRLGLRCSACGFAFHLPRWNAYTCHHPRYKDLMATALLA